jgi:DNA repair exonuclease SbcCD nuclease subunit
MKIALISDTHWGVKNDSPVMLDHMKEFINETFFPYLRRHSIKSVVHLGDLVDRRKYININTAKRLREDFLDPIAHMDLDFHIIAGNHDTYYKNTNNVNSLSELVKYQYPNFKVYDNYPLPVSFYGTNVLMTPWICDENREHSMRIIREANSPILFGHLELAGFPMYVGAPPSDGDDPSIFSRFDTVCSGHYHHRSSRSNIHYLGSPCEFTWADYNDKKGFHIFDTETRELEFIENPKTMFEKMWYDDATLGHEPEGYDLSHYAGKHIKVIVKNKLDPYRFDMFIGQLEKRGVHDLQVVEDHLNLNLEEDADIINEAEDTMSILRKYLTGMSANTDIKVRVEKIVTDLYTKAQTIE